MRFATRRGNTAGADTGGAMPPRDLLALLESSSDEMERAGSIAAVVAALLRAAVACGSEGSRLGLCGERGYAMWSLGPEGGAVSCGTAPTALYSPGKNGVLPLAVSSGPVGILDTCGAAIPEEALRALKVMCRQAAFHLESLGNVEPDVADSAPDMDAWWGARDLESLSRAAIHDVARLCGADSAAIVLPDPHSGFARMTFSEDIPAHSDAWQSVTSQRRNGEALLRVLQTGEPLEFRWNPVTEALKMGLLPAGPAEGSWAAVPMVDERGVLGVLDIYSKEPRRFGPIERDRLHHAARFLGRLLSRLSEDVRRADARRRDGILLDAVSELADQQDTRHLSAALARAARRLWPDADIAYTMLPQREGGLWSIAALESDNPDDDRRGWARAGEGFAGWVIQTHESLCITEAPTDPRRGALDQGQGIAAGIWAPMRRHGQTLGLLCVASTRSDRRYSADDAESLSLLARHGAASLERAGERHVAEESFWDAIEAISAAIDARDGYTHGHSRNVTEYAVAIATRMGLPHREIQTLRASALLHDIGKIGIPDHILNKPGNLTHDERVVMESHPEVGYQILLRAPSLQAILPGVRYHHERPDGKGYPCNLSGDALPRQARIMAVADAFDAMTSDRVYRKRMTVEKAIGILSGGRGAQWDADCVDHFLALVEARATPRLQLLAAEDSGRQYLPSLGLDVFGA